MSKIVHYDANGRGMYRAASAECGVASVNVPITSNVKQVTCKNCMKTAIYKSGLDEYKEQEEFEYRGEIPDGG